VVHLYIDMASQPSRSILTAVKYLGLPYEIHETSIFKQENKAPEYLKINPAGNVPFMTCGKYANQESTDSLRWLANKVPSAGLYPKGNEAEIDRLLEFNAKEFRPATVMPIITRLGMVKDVTKEAAHEKMLSGYSKLNAFCKVARQKNTFLAGTDKPTIGDIQLFCEATDCYVVAAEDEVYETFPAISWWVQKMQEHQAINQVKHMMVSGAARMIKAKFGFDNKVD